MWFNKLVSEHIDWIARQAFVYCRNKYDADDLAQETLLRILSNRDKFDSSRDFKPWALTIMANIYKTHRARMWRVPFIDADDEAYEVLTNESADISIRFHDALNALRAAARMSVGVECVILYAKGYSYYDIADMVGIGVGTVKSRISAGRQLIHRLIGE